MCITLVRLTNFDIKQLSNELVTIIGKGNKERQVYLTPAAKSAVNAWLSERNNYNLKETALFISNRVIHLTTRAIQIIIKNAAKAAGLPFGISPHKLRHTSSTLLYKHGSVDIRALQKILGHKSISTTEIYTHIDNRQFQTAVNMNPLSGVVNRTMQV